MLGTIDIDDCVEANMKEVEDWEANFKLVKTRGREVDRLIPSEEKVDCITVNLQEFKSTAEDLLKRFTDALSNSLRKSAQVSFFVPAPVPFCWVLRACSRAFLLHRVRGAALPVCDLFLC